MKITRLRVEQLRRFRRPLELDGFAPGLNILAGPNEAGKSTLVRAIRAAFFERHKSAMVEDLRPWGEGGGAAPRVEIDFDFGGAPHRLAKSFLGRKRCVLQIGTRQLDGAEAEDHLAQLLGFAYAGKGASKAEHQGIPGLLWVEQGSGQELEVQHARRHLHDALQDRLGDEAGALAATGGDALLARLQAWRDELLTGTGKPRAEHQQALDAVAAHQQALAALDAQIAGYRQQVDQLAALRRQHAADEHERPWDALDAQLDAARRTQARLDDAGRQLADSRRRLDELARTRALLAQGLDALDRPQRDLAARTEALAQAEAALQAADAACAQARAQAEAAEARAEAARAAADQARQQALRDSLAGQLQQAQGDAARTAQALARAQAAEAALAQARTQAAALPAIAEAELQQLRQHDRALAEAALRHQATATRLAWTLPPGPPLELRQRGAGQPLQAEGELLLDAPAALHLPGGGVLRITPGGQDLARLADAHARARQALRQALDALGLADLAEAEARFAARQDRQARVRLAEQALAIVAPQGMAALHDAATAAQARLQAAQAACARLPATPAEPPAAPADAEAALQAATRAAQAARDTLAQAQRRQAAAAGGRDAARAECQAAQAAVDAPDRPQRLADIQRQLLDTTAEQQALAAQVAAAEAALQSARPDIVAQDIARLSRSAEQQRQAHRLRHEQILVLQAALQQAGAEGLEERRAALAGELARAERRLDELRRRAAALDLLCRKLQSRRQAALARLQAPLAGRLQHYLPLLLPGAALQMDEQLAPGLVTRGGAEAGPLQALSFGAREQLGLIARFAYADLLQQAGRPTLLILDDALTHSDAERLALMKRVLFDAAQRHQVLLFTCHPELWRDMGVAVRLLGGG
ncbi:AAA family ATPase [Pseudorhodoferax sp.]|uniref:AAA family ATPase n=1 Tax=Pseudorhodoferax sp. TaxID=1993553 RepID=UPI0039E55123